MSDQGSRHGIGGHPAITQTAVDLLFHSGAAVDGRVAGHTEAEYFHKLNQAQAHQDSLLGKTWWPAHLAPSVQREHGLADPNLTGPENLSRNKDYVLSQLLAAYAAKTDDEMFRHLGYASHAVQDSYSTAHVLRGDSVYRGDPHAPINSFTVFEPLELSGIGHGHWEGTHVASLDKVPVDSSNRPVLGSDEAGVRENARLLEIFHALPRGDAQGARAALAKELDLAYTPGHDPLGGPGASVGVHIKDNAAFEAEIHRREQLHLQHPWDSFSVPGEQREAPDPARPTGDLPPLTPEHHVQARHTTTDHTHTHARHPSLTPDHDVQAGHTTTGTTNPVPPPLDSQLHAQPHHAADSAHASTGSAQNAAHSSVVDVASMIHKSAHDMLAAAAAQAAHDAANQVHLAGHP